MCLFSALSVTQRVSKSHEGTHMLRVSPDRETIHALKTLRIDHINVAGAQVGDIDAVGDCCRCGTEPSGSGLAAQICRSTVSGIPATESMREYRLARKSVAATNITANRIRPVSAARRLLRRRSNVIPPRLARPVYRAKRSVNGTRTPAVALRTASEALKR